MWKKLVQFMLACLPAERFVKNGIFSMTNTAHDAVDLAENEKVCFISEKDGVYGFMVEGKTGKHAVYVSVDSRVIERHLNVGTTNEKILRSRRIESKLELAVLVSAMEEYSKERRAKAGVASV